MCLQDSRWGKSRWLECSREPGECRSKITVYNALEKCGAISLCEQGEEISKTFKKRVTFEMVPAALGLMSEVMNGTEARSQSFVRMSILVNERGNSPGNLLWRAKF